VKRDETRPLPRNLEAERSVLGAILLENAFLDYARDKLIPDAFSHAGYRLIFLQMIAMRERELPIDVVSLWEELRRVEKLEQAGGPDAISTLSDGVPVALECLQNWVRILNGKAERRKLIRHGRDCIEGGFDESRDLGETLPTFQADLSAIHVDGSGTSWRKSFETLGQMLAHGVVKFAIDNFLIEGHVTMLGAPTGHGKTWLGLSMVRALSTGRNFLGLGRFRVNEVMPTLYLVPEINSQMISARAAKMGIPDDERFLFRTLTKGASLPLDHPHIVNAVRELRPGRFLRSADTVFGGRR
jgi:hypothetical protein